MSVVYSRRLKKELQEIHIEQADPAKRAAGASLHPILRRLVLSAAQASSYSKLKISRRGISR
jgi:hypothetical protein